MIFISRTYLPPLKEYNKYLKRIWKSNWLTNNGELVQELEKKLEKRFGVKHVVCVANGTSALQIAVKALGWKGKFYVSPYNFAPTVTAPMWEGLTPEFVDLNEEFKGPAISTHIYGIPNIIKAKPVIYDASHAFAVQYKGKSILAYGDVSIISFSAVKIFQTVEGGAVVTNNDEIAEKARWMRNYGFKDRYSFNGVGINSKMSEFHAAMGLAVLPQVDRVVKRYAEIIDIYNKELGYSHQGVTYYPIWYSSEAKLTKAIKEFEKHGISPRRYFYPPLNKAFGGKPCPLAEDSMSRVLCLPLYYTLKKSEINAIIKIAKETL